MTRTRILGRRASVSRFMWILFGSIVVGGLVFGFGIVRFVEAFRFQQLGTVTIGTVVGQVEGSCSATSCDLSSDVRFDTGSGEVTIHIAVGPDDLPGSPIKLWYMESDPSQATTTDPRSKYTEALILVAIPVVIIFLVWLGYRRESRRTRTARHVGGSKPDRSARHLRD